MAKGLYEGRVLSTEPYTDKKTQAKRWQTNVAIGSEVFRVPGAGFDPLKPVFVYGEIKRYENRTYLAEGAEIWERAETATLHTLLTGEIGLTAVEGGQKQQAAA